MKILGSTTLLNAGFGISKDARFQLQPPGGTGFDLVMAFAASVEPVVLARGNYRAQGWSAEQRE